MNTTMVTKADYAQLREKVVILSIILMRFFINVDDSVISDF